MRKLSGALLFFVFATATRAEWETVSTRTEPSTAPGVEHRHVVLEDSETGDRATLDLALFPAKSHALHVIDNPDGEKSLLEAMSLARCVAGVNGGYFNPDFAPIGLRVVDSKLLAPLLRARLLTGVLISSPRGIQIVRSGEFSRKAKLDAAVQCGPNLVDGTRPVRGLNDTKTARRTFAATASSGRAAIGYCSSVTLAELAQILSTVALGEGVKVQRAMNLDGGSSSAFWFKREDGSAFSIRGQKPVRDFIGVVAKE